MSDKDDQMYVYQLFGVNQVRRIKATKDLRNKIGPHAKIDETMVKRAQKYIEHNTASFKPYAMDFIAELEGLIAGLRQTSYDRENNYNDVTVPIVQLKGHAAMFGNYFVSDISKRMLSFLDHYKRLDDEVMDILSGYCTAVITSYENLITKSEDSDAQDLLKEFEAALQRYHKKFKKRTEQ